MSNYESELREKPRSYPVWGETLIDAEAKKQMDHVMRLPIAAAGALMPDAHVGYGLPIGGVLAVEDAVLPYAVGVDIACRMSLSVFPVSPIVLGQRPEQFRNALLEQTVFGTGGERRGGRQAEHAVMDSAAWQAVPLLRSLKDKAWLQLGTSGSGNHFVEWGAFTLAQRDDALNLDAGEYLALLTHSGSRGLGYQIATHFLKRAQELHPRLDKTIQHLAWLPMDTHEGQSYWLSMELAGEYAAANHEVIHQLMAKAVKLKPILVIENHHNFAWKETIDVTDDLQHGPRAAIVHRKGATPAGSGVLGIIPGSMGDPGFVVRGKGNGEALNSASHGAGRKVSRSQALESITKSERNRYLKERGVTLFGGDLDESPQAYKSIDDVIAAQHDLIDVIGRFMPRMVRMDGSLEQRDGKHKKKDKRR